LRYDTTTKELEEAKNVSLFTTAFNGKQTIVNVRLKSCLGPALKNLSVQLCYVRMLKDTKTPTLSESLLNYNIFSNLVLISVCLHTQHALEMPLSLKSTEHTPVFWVI